MAQERRNSVYCTIFDDNYLARAVALYESLMRVNQSAVFAFICIDFSSAQLLTSLKLERALVVKHDEFATQELLQLRPERSQGEYCWTCKPFALLHLMKRAPQADWVVYVDTDMMFFSDPDEVLPGSAAHYLLTPHRFDPGFMAHEKSAGKHNAGYVGARNSRQGEQVITWWKDRCVESCSFVPTESTFADQKYLDQFLALFPFGISTDHKGLNVAPWNVENFNVHVKGDQVYVDDVPLLLYHFQGLQLFDNGTASLYIGDKRVSEGLRRNIYYPHLRELLRAFARIRELDGRFCKGLGKERKYLGNFVKRTYKMLVGTSNVVPLQLHESVN